ncbi:MAG: glycosyltransferase [Spirochaetales bacterium]|nr:glycosyltransferase [Spirochaetales bacterium]
MQQEPYVTLCIPLKNGEEHIHHVLANISRTAYPHEKIEVIFGDHGSTDNSKKIVQEYGKNSPLIIKIIDVSYNGPNRAFNRNQIIKHAGGSVLLFIDHDILVSQDFISEHVAMQRRFPGCMVTGYTFGKESITQLKTDIAMVNLNNINSSFTLLQSSHEFKDIRESEGFIQNQGYHEILNGIPGSWRLFWTCNLSVLKKDIEELGGFDEHFTGWGLEDEEFAYKFYLAGKTMIIANRAWAFHIPHSTDTRRNIVSWRKNWNHFFHKYPCREIELLYFFEAISSGEFLLKTNLVLFMPASWQKTVISRLVPDIPKREGERLGLFMYDEDDARLFSLTQCFLPFLPWNRINYRKEDCCFYSLMGFKTPFQDKSIHETLIIADNIIILNEMIVDHILTEMERVSRKLILLYGDIHKEEIFSGYIDTFERKLDKLDIDIIRIK